jgi:1,4-dihydroxy-2-naphthoate octaprenyltransferase
MGRRLSRVEVIPLGILMRINYDCRMTSTQFFRIVEMRTKIISMGTFFMASVYGYYLSGTVHWPIFFIMLFATLAVDMGTTGFNTYFDFRRGTDSIEYTKESGKVLVHDGVSPNSALLISASLFLIAAVLGLYLASMTSWYLIPVGGICMFVGFVYTGGPFPISRTPFGELFAGGFLGTVLFLIVLFVQGFELSLANFLITIPLWIHIAMILSVNNTCDLVGDKANGRKTLAILLGPDKAPYLILAEGIIVYGGIVLLTLSGIYPLSAGIINFLALIVWIDSYRKMMKAGFDASTKEPNIALVSKAFLVFVFTFILGFALSAVLAW